jgi:hypothetical protein
MALFYDPITDEAGPSRTWEEDEEEFEELYGSKGYASYVLKVFIERSSFLPSCFVQLKLPLGIHSASLSFCW